MLGRAPLSEDGVATELIPMDEWVQELHVTQEEARKLILAHIESEHQDRVESMPHWSRTWEAGNQVMLLADCKGKGQSKKLSKKWMGPYTIIEQTLGGVSTRSSGLAMVVSLSDICSVGC